MPSGHTPSHSDTVRPSFAPGDGQYTANPAMKQHPGKEGYGSVPDNCPNIEVSHPAPDIETLHRRKHLAVAFHEDNKSAWWYESPFSNDGTTLYDLGILDVADQVFEIEDFDAEEPDVLRKRLNLFFLQQAREQDNIQAFYRYIEGNEPVLTAAGYDDPDNLCSASHYNRVVDTLEEELEPQRAAFDRACCRAVYSVYRNGIDAPDAVMQQYDFAALGPPIKEWHLPYDYEQTALAEWIRHLADETLDPLRYNRDRTQTDYEPLDFVALGASSAKMDGGLQNASKVVSWDHPSENIPSGRGLPDYISALDIESVRGSNPEIPTINQQFDAVHSNTFAVADELGVIDDSHTLGVDLYRIEWTGSDDAPTIGRLPKAENEVESEWVYVIIGILDKEARLTLGTRWLPKKDTYPAKVKEILPESPRYFDVDELYADAEMVSGELLDGFRTIVESEYIVRAPTRGALKNLQKATPSNYVGFAPDVSWNTASEPNAVAYPLEASDPSTIEFKPANLKGELSFPSMDTQSTLTEYSSEGSDTSNSPDLPPIYDEFETPSAAPGYGDKTTHVTYFTGRSLPERSAANIHFPYYGRWALEQSINQISNHVMPVFQGSHPERRLYAVNLAILFQNWHTIINRAVSPDPYYRIDCTHQEMLTAIQHVAFSDAEWGW